MITTLERGKNAEPLYVQVANIIRQHILSGSWRDGDSIPPEKTLCADFNIARGTLRQALQILENEGYLWREQGRGTFIRSAAGFAEETNGPHQAFVVPYIRDSSVSTILVGFQQIAEEAGYSVIFNHVNNSLRQQQDVLQKLIKQGVSGIALYPVDSESFGVINQIVRTRFPLVLVDRYLRRLTTDFVMSDHFGGALRGVHFLLDQGHERVGFISWLSPAISMDHRLLGYTQALRERGIALDESLLGRVEGYPTVNHTPLIDYLRSPQRPSAVFAANDQIAIALYRAAAAVGLRIPDDLSVMGFDNLDISSHLDPPLTTVAQPFLQIGRRAAELLFERIRGESHTLQQITLATHIVERSSVLQAAASPALAQV